MWVDYLGLWLLFLAFLMLTVGIYYYARWQIKGPIVKMKWKRFKSWILMENRSKVKVKKGTVDVDQQILEEIERTKGTATTSQDQIKVQKMETDLERQKQEALKAYEEKSSAVSSMKKMFKKQNKEEVKEETTNNSQGQSIFDQLGEGDSAQDLLHREPETETIDVNIKEDE